MIARKRRIVLYHPQQWADRPGPPYSRWTEEMPLALLSIAGWPLRDGYDVVLIDGSRYPPEEAQRRVVEACEGALLYATTGILGYQVADAYRCSQRVRARHPELPMFIGGWFASVAPELQLETGLYQAVAIGQGEITFRELVQAVDAGEPLEGIEGLVIRRDGEIVRTPPRSVVGWDRLLNCPWQLIDVELYREPQRCEANRGTLGRVCGPGRPRFEIVYYSSFGCPLQCTFCCSPQFSGLRWKCMPAGRMLDDLSGLQERWKFDGVHFYDANFGVLEKRMSEFAEGLLERDLRLATVIYIQAETILQAKESTLDALAASGLYLCIVGGEVGTQEMMARVKKNTRAGGNLQAAQALDRRGISPVMTYIIGRPDEDAESMLATLEEARQIASSCPRAQPSIWPYRPIPGAEDFSRALELGYQPPTTLEEWGAMGDYCNEEPWAGRIPPEVMRQRNLFMHYSSLAQGRVRQRQGWWERRARRRLEQGTYGRGRLEARTFHLYNKLTGRILARCKPPAATG